MGEWGVPVRNYSPGIRFNDCYFTEPTRLADWAPPRIPGLFVILACDPNWAPKSFQPLCFGEFGNNSRYPLEQGGYAWLTGAVGRGTLFVAVLPMPFSTSTQREALRLELIAAYNPLLQAGPLFQAGACAPPPDLAQRIDQMERRHQEHAAQVLLLLGSIHKQFEPQPVPQRRRIGFLPEPAPAGDQQPTA